MSWNYRVIKRIERHHHGNEPVYTINTVFYDEGGRVKQWSDEPAWPVGDTVEELKSDCEKFLRAFELPVLAQSEREDGAKLHAGGPGEYGGYPFKMQDDLVERGEWDETGARYAKPRNR